MAACQALAPEVSDRQDECKVRLGTFRRIRSIRLPFAATLLLSRLVERYHAVSKGQIPQVLTPYRAKNVWGGHVYDNGRLKRTGWVQLVSTEDALRETFSEFRARLKVNGATPARGRHG